MFPTTATSRTQSATTAVRLAIFIVSSSKKKSGGRNVIRTTKVSKKKEKRKSKSRVFAIAQDSESESDVESESDSSLFHLFKVNSERSKSDAIWLRQRINDVKLKMELDTGSALSIISNRDYRRHFNSLKLKETPIELKTYTGEVVKLLGVLNVTVKHKDQSAAKLPLYVVQNGGPPLFGRDWLSDIQFYWQHIKSLLQTKQTSNLDSLLNKYGVVFGSELGTLRGMKEHALV